MVENLKIFNSVSRSKNGQQPDENPQQKLIKYF